LHNSDEFLDWEMMKKFLEFDFVFIADGIERNLGGRNRMN
jgi:hypothetical protein